MKKILVLAVIAIFVMMPFATFAKTAMSDNDMASVTAKEGVTITLSGSGVSIGSQNWGTPTPTPTPPAPPSTSVSTKNKYFIALLNILYGKKGSSNGNTSGSGVNNGGIASSSYMGNVKGTINLGSFGSVIIKAH
jgi:hypothetical protein